MTRRKRIRMIAALAGFCALLAMFLWLVESDRFRPERPKPSERSEVQLPPSRSADTAIINIEDDTIAPGIVAEPDNTDVPEMPDTVRPPDSGDVITQGPDTTAPPRDMRSLFPPGKLLIPVAGITSEELLDTYNDARSEGRVHNAIDIMAPEGTPVLAAADGTIVKLFQSEKGGTTIYQLDPNQRVIYYYAHLQRYADGITEGYRAIRGEVIGYVGDTGNAGEGNYHLHFGISIVDNPRQYWGGVPVNPYPILRNAEDRGESGR